MASQQFAVSGGINVYMPESAHEHFLVHIFTRLVSPMTRPFREHRHIPVEIAMIRRGAGLYAVEGGVISFSAGDIFIFPSNVVHHITRIFEGSALELFNIQIDPKFIGRPEPGFAQPHFFGFFFQTADAAQAMKLSPGEAAHAPIARLFDSIGEEVLRRADNWLAMTDALLTQLLILTARLAPAAPRAEAPVKKRYMLVVNEVINYLHAHLTEKVTLEAVAGVVHLSPNYLCTLFRQVTHTTIWDYLTEARVEFAMQYIENHPQETLLNTALSSGFNNTQNFNKMFLKYAGCTPGQYRENGGY